MGRDFKPQNIFSGNDFSSLNIKDWLEIFEILQYVNLRAHTKSFGQSRESRVLVLN